MWALATLVLSGCISEHSVSFEVGPEPYIVMEHGIQKRMWVVLIKRESSGGGEKLTATYPFLANIAPHNIAEASSLWKALPPKYLLARTSTPNLISAILGVTSPSLANTKNTLQPVRWIISVDPLIVGIGTKLEMPRNQAPGEYSKFASQLDSTCSLIQKDDTNELVSDLVIVDTWPTRWPEFTYSGRSQSWETVIGESLSSHTKRLALPAGTTIDQAFQDNFWKN